MRRSLGKPLLGLALLGSAVSVYYLLRPSGEEAVPPRVGSPTRDAGKPRRTPVEELQDDAERRGLRAVPLVQSTDGEAQPSGVEPSPSTAGAEPAADPDRAALSVRGSVVDTSGNVVPDQELWFVRPARAGSELLTPESRPRVAAAVQSDGRGDFQLEALPPGRYLVGASPSAGGTFAALATELELQGDARDGPLRVVLEPGRWIEGHLRFLGGTPVEGALVAARRDGVSGWLGAATAADGSFRLGPLADGAWIVDAREVDEHFTVAAVQAHAGQSDVQLTLVAAGALVVQALRLDTRSPIEGSVALIRDADDALPNGTWTGRVDPESGGRVAFDAVEPGTYDVVASSDDLAWYGRERALTVSEGGSAGEVLVLLAEAGRIRAKAPSGSGALVFIALQDGAAVHNVHLEPGTETRFAVAPGEVLLRFDPPESWGPTEWVVQVAAGEELEVSLEHD